MVRTKVFVGNLSFKTRENELAQAFSRAGQVLEAHIITRGSRSLGYGFVDFGSEEEAQRAVQLMNKQEINERPVNCEIAKPREEVPAGSPQQPRQPRPPRPRRERPQGGAPIQGQSPQGQQQPQQQQQQPQHQHQQQQQQQQPQGGLQQQGGSPQGLGQRPRRRRAPRRRPDGQPQQLGQQVASPGLQGGVPQQQQQGGAPQQPRQPREPREPREPRAPRPPRRDQSPKNPSHTTLFVANLPFSVTDETLHKIFGDTGNAPKAAHVVIKRNNRSKGFGFVEFNSEEEQKKALAAVDKLTVEGRELAVKVALTELPVQQNAGPSGQQQ